MGKKTGFFLLFWVILLLFPRQALANAGPAGWEGSGRYELLVEENCPIEITGERLTIQLDGSKTGYTLLGDVTAVYTLHNPLENSCTVQAAFPGISFYSGEPDDWPSPQVVFQGQTLSCERKTAPLYGLEPETATFTQMLDQVSRLQEQPLDRVNHLELVLFTMDFAPGETAELTVSSKMAAFMERETYGQYADIGHYITAQTDYTFYYFFSPAAHWRSFQNLELELRLSSAAPVLTQTSLPLQKKGLFRYTYSGNQLPEENFSFTVSSSWRYTALFWLTLLLLAAGLWLLARRRPHHRPR